MTPTQRLAGMLLGTPVNEWIKQRRDQGIAWRVIARDLYQQTNGQIDVTHESLRRWIEEDAA